jgi:hypothetical protein
MKTAEVLEYLRKGFYISLCEEYQGGYHHIDLSLTNGGDDYELHWRVFKSLKKKNLLVERLAYSTIQPDTKIYEYRLIKRITK